MKKIYLFDFDGTLCDSGEFNQLKLNDPKPIKKNIDKYKELLGAGENVQILTARKHKSIVKDFLLSQNLPLVRINALGNASDDAKAKFIKHHMKGKDVTLFDDRDQYLDAAKELLKDSDVVFHGVKASVEALPQISASRQILAYDYDFVSDFHGKVDEYIQEIFFDVLNGKTQQQWDVIPSARVFKIWNDYAKLGFVRDASGIDKMKDLVMNNIAKAYANTAMVGHLEYDALGEMIDEYNNEYPDLDADEFEEKVYDYIVADQNAKYSDYAMQQLVDMYSKLHESSSPEETLQLLDRVFNIVHMRGDIAGWFIEGGAATLNQLAGYEKVEAFLKIKTSINQDKELRSKITDFVVSSPGLDDSDFHAYVESIGVDPHEAEEMVYSMLQEFAPKAQTQLEKGINVEKEHDDTYEWIKSYHKENKKFPSIEDVREHIAQVHIDEIPDYYDRLEDEYKAIEKIEGIFKITSAIIKVMALFGIESMEVHKAFVDTAQEMGLQMPSEDVVDKIMPSEDDPTKYVNYSKQGRDVKTKLGKILKILFPDIDENTVRQFAEKYQTRMASEKKSSYTFEIADAKKAYQCGIGSCVTSHGIDLDFYNYIPAKALLMSNSNGEMIGRALLWIGLSPSGYYVDRTYPAGDSKIYNEFVGYAEKQGWDYREGMGYDDYNNAPDMKFSIEDASDKFELVPYMDTFRFGTYDAYANRLDFSNNDGSITFDKSSGVEFQKPMLPNWVANAATDGMSAYVTDSGYFVWENGTWKYSVWENGTWKDGIWEFGTWKDGIWENGTWKYGLWENGTWKDGTWEFGKIYDPDRKGNYKDDWEWDGDYVISPISPKEYFSKKTDDSVDKIQGVFKEDAARYHPDENPKVSAYVEYMQAIESEDMDKVAKMVKDAADRAGYSIGPVYHGTNAEYTEFAKTQQNDAGWLGKGFYFYGDEEQAMQYGKVNPYFLALDDTYYISDDEYEFLVDKDDKDVSTEFTEQLIRDGYDSVFYNGDLREEFCVFDPTKIKLADPITYDDQGDIIPLSKRFDSSSKDVRANKQIDILKSYVDKEGFEENKKWLLNDIIDNNPDVKINIVDSFQVAAYADIRAAYKRDPERIAQIRKEHLALMDFVSKNFNNTFTLTKPEDSYTKEWKAIFHPSTKMNGYKQLTLFDDSGAIGDDQIKSEQELVDLLQNYGFARHLESAEIASGVTAKLSQIVKAANIIIEKEHPKIEASKTMIQKMEKRRGEPVEKTLRYFNENDLKKYAPDWREIETEDKIDLPDEIYNGKRYGYYIDIEDCEYVPHEYKTKAGVRNRKERSKWKTIKVEDGEAIKKENGIKTQAAPASAWHGSPHEFEEFSTENIGTGEGVQSFGWGLYFTDKETIADFYRNMRNTVSIQYNGATIKDLPDVAKIADKGSVEYDALIGILVNKNIDKAISVMRNRNNNDSADWLESHRDDIKVVGGSKFKVTLWKDKQETLLNWDSLISEQSEKVKQVFDETYKKEPSESTISDDDWNKLFQSDDLGLLDINPEATDKDFVLGRQFYSNLSKQLGSDKAASEYLYSKGVDGIRYLTEGGTGGGTGDAYNYVVFNDKDITIEDVIKASINKDPKIRKKLLDFILNSPNLDDKDFHTFVESIGIDPHEAEEMVYSMLQEFAPKAQTQLEKGINVEKEHDDTYEWIKSYHKENKKFPSIEDVREHIAQIHIDEIPDYYDRLEDEYKAIEKIEGRFTSKASSDEEYFAAIESGDMDRVAKMVEEAAMNARYSIGPVYHTSEESFNKFSRNNLGANTNEEGNYEEWSKLGFHFSNSRKYANKIAGTSRSFYLENATYFEMTGEEVRQLLVNSEWEEFEDFRESIDGYDGIYVNSFDDMNVVSDHYIAFYPNQIKSADLITYDDSGEIIPLSKRFNSASNDIRARQNKLSQSASNDKISVDRIEGVMKASSRKYDEMLYNGEYIPIYISPEKDEIISIVEKSEIGGIRFGVTEDNKYFAWDADMLHDDVSRDLGLRFVTKVSGDNKRKDAFATIYEKRHIEKITEYLKIIGIEELVTYGSQPLYVER